jgi:hypothetical protein
VTPVIKKEATGVRRQEADGNDRGRPKGSGKGSGAGERKGLRSRKQESAPDPFVPPLGESEAEGIDGPEIGAVVGRADGGDEASDLVRGEDVGEAFLPGDAEALECGPVSECGVRIEELNTAVSDAEGSGGEVAVVLEVEEVLADLRLGEAIGRGAEVVGEHADGAEVGVLSARGEAGELEVVGQALTE